MLKAAHVYFVRLLCVLLGRAKELSDMHGRCSLFMLETLREVLRVEHDPACEAVYAELRRSVFDAVCTAWTAETGVSVYDAASAADLEGGDLTVSADMAARLIADAAVEEACNGLSFFAALGDLANWVPATSRRLH